MKLAFFAVLATCALGLSGCLKGDENTCSQTVTESATSVTGPKAVAVNQPATYTISYPIQSPCGKSSGALEQAQGNTRYVGVQVVYTGCSCPQSATTNQTTYTFTPTQTGTYFIKFATGVNMYLTDTLVVK